MIKKLKHRNQHDKTFLNLALLVKGIIDSVIVYWLLKSWFTKTHNSEEVLTNIFFKSLVRVPLRYNLTSKRLFRGEMEEVKFYPPNLMVLYYSPAIGTVNCIGL